MLIWQEFWVISKDKFQRHQNENSYSGFLIPEKMLTSYEEGPFLEIKPEADKKVWDPKGASQHDRLWTASRRLQDKGRKSDISFLQGIDYGQNINLLPGYGENLQ